MTKLSLEFKRSVLDKLKAAHITLLKKPTMGNDLGWKRNPKLGKGSIHDIELKPEFKQLLKNCDVVPQLDGDADPSFQFRRSTGEEILTIPWPHQFETEEAFYRVLLHELGHWSGLPSRLDREMGELDCCKYHSALGAVEEVTAEMASVFLAEHFGFTPNYVRATDYINGYISHIAEMAPEDKIALWMQATQQASKVADYIASLA